MFEGLDPLSGHLGVPEGVAFSWLLVAPVRCRAWSFGAAIGVTATVGEGVLLAGWHRLPQVVTPLLICAGWALVAPARRGKRAPERVGCPLVGAALLGTAVLLVGEGLRPPSAADLSSLIVVPHCSS